MSERFNVLMSSISFFFFLEISTNPNQWLAHFTSPANRHVLPLLTSLLNVVCTYDPVGYGVP